MSDYLVISDVGQSLVRVLWNAMKDDSELGDHINDPSEISLDSPSAVQRTSEVRLSVYLFRVVEDPYTKNQQPGEGRGGRIRKAPLTLDLHYMITPLFGQAQARHALLGRVLSIFYDHPTLSGSDLAGSLAGTREEIRLVLNPVALDEIARVWEALRTDFELSVCYIARVAMLDSTVEQFVPPVLSKRTRYGTALAT